MMFYPRQRYFRSYLSYSSSLYDAITPLKCVTVRKDWKHDRWQNHLMTPFVEVGVVPHHEVQREFLREYDCQTEIESEPYDIDDFASMYMELIKEAIGSAWKSDKFHVFAVSSGFDSRCITMAIKELAEEKGKDWLGDVLFFEAAGEGDAMKAIMEIEGWDKSQYISCYDGIPRNRHLYSFDFDKAWRRLNGHVSYPLNVWYTPIQWLQEQGIIPDDDKIQCFTMYGANETTRACKHLHQTPEFYFWWHYYHMLSMFPLKGEWVHPCYYGPLIAYLHANRKYIAKVSDALSVCSVVVPTLYPELDKVQRLGTSDMWRRGQLNPDPDIIRKTEEDYRRSWYGTNVHPESEPCNDIEYRDWWGNWVLASLCERLLREGKIINVC